MTKRTWGWRVVLDVLGSMVALMFMDDRGKVVYASQRWTELTGWLSSEIKGLHWSVYVHPDDLADARRAGSEAVRTASSVSYESRVLSPGGATTTWIRSRVAPICPDDGPPRGWLLVADDLTEHQQVLEALHLSDERLQVIFDRSPEVLTILESDGTWRSSSVSTAWNLGLDAEELATAGWWSCVHPDDRTDARQVLQALVEQPRGSEGILHEVRLVAPSGECRWIETVGVNLADEPSVRGIVLHSRDVTERRQSEQALRSANARLSGLLEAMHLGVHVCDEHGMAVAVNPAFFKVLQVPGTPEDMLEEGAGRWWHRLQRVWADPVECEARLGEIVEHRRLEVDARFLLVDGRSIGIDFVPIEDGDTSLGYVWLMRDVTEDAALAAEREYLLEMERRQNARLVELDTLKSELLASVSHEIRTPLTAIASFTQLLSDGLEGGSAEDHREMLSVIGRNVDRLQRMVDDLLFLDRFGLEPVPADLDWVEVRSVVNVAASSVRPVADARGVRLEVHTEAGPPLRGDAQRIGQLVDNLLVNAVRFTPSGGRVDVRALPTGTSWRIEVSDTGIGIPEGEEHRVFERFYRASNARQEVTSGSGLGLAVVKRVAEFHGGTVEVKSTLHEGTTFTVELTGACEQPAILSPLSGMVSGDRAR